MLKLLLILCSLSASLASAYPQAALIKNYKYCSACHVSPMGGGGGPLNDYGRGMSETFMSTLAREGEAQELFTKSYDWLSLGADYRKIEMRNPDASFHMLTEGEVALHFKGLTFDYSFGLYGREKNPESRRHYLMFNPTNKSAIWIGKFMPPWGIMTNDHSLFIKSRLGLARGNEIYGLGGWYATRDMQVYGSVGTRDFTLDSLDDGTYQLINREPQAARVRLSYIGIDQLEIGANWAQLGSETYWGIFGKSSLIKDQYALIEFDKGDELEVIYARLGYFVFRGFDIFYDYQSSRSFSETSIRGFGLDWMVAPRLEIGIRSSQDNLGNNTGMGQLHLWL